MFQIRRAVAADGFVCRWSGWGEFRWGGVLMYLGCMSVTEYPPPAALAPFVDVFWSGSPGPHPIFPDGCLDIIVGPRQAIVVGAMTRPVVVAPADGAGPIGVRFRPGMASAFLRIPAAALTDDRAPLEVIWPDGGQVADYVGSALGTDRAISRLTETLTSRLSRIAPVPPDLLLAVDRISAAGGRIDVSRLAASLRVTRQHLARRFAAHVGVPPKTFCRVVRLWTVLRSAPGGRVNWAALAADLGYSDQSHLVSEFRSLTGLTPGRWLASRLAGSKTPSRRLRGALP
jgi:AraC-like DNA-binding protein